MLKVAEKIQEKYEAQYHYEILGLGKLETTVVLFSRSLFGQCEYDSNFQNRSVMRSSVTAGKLFYGAQHLGAVKLHWDKVPRLKQYGGISITTHVYEEPNKIGEWKVEGGTTTFQVAARFQPKIRKELYKILKEVVEEAN